MAEATPKNSRGQVTRLLQQWSSGDQTALDELMPLIHAELRQQASGCLRRERQGHTLETSALVNEAFLRLVDQDQVRWQSRAHFLAIAGRQMRRILVDHARRHAAAKRGGGAERVPIDEVELAAAEPRPDLLALDQALERLAEDDSEIARVVELRYFAGLNREEIAEVMHLSSASITRRWRLARAWLYRELAGQEPHED